MDRRLRKRRSDARIRLRIAADASLLANHHASAVPFSCTCGCPSGARVVGLLEALVTQQSALCGAITGFIGWQAGLAGYAGAGYSPEMLGTSTFCTGGNADMTPSGPAPCAGHMDSSGPVDAAGVSDKVDATLSPENSSPGKPLICDGGGARVDTSGNGGVSSDSVVATGVLTSLSYSDFIASDHYEFLQADFTDRQRTFIDSFSNTGFPDDWDTCGILSRVLASDPRNSNLLGYDITQLYALVHLRRREVSDFPYSIHQHLTPEKLDDVFIGVLDRMRGARS